jgi:hypothetical protein
VDAQATRRVLLENSKLMTKRKDFRLQGSTSSKTGGYQSKKGDEKRAHGGSHHELTNDRNPSVFRSDGIFGNHKAFPFDQVPRYLLRDRDAIFGQDFREQVRDMGIHEVLSAPRSPWQRAYVERVIGSIRRECLDHVVVFNAMSLRRILASYFTYYHRSRTHLSLGKDSPVPRPIQPPAMGPVVAVPQVGGLHHRYERRAA